MPVGSNAHKQPIGISEVRTDERQQISLCEVLDRVLNKGIVVAGEATISVAGIDLVYLGLQMILTSVETARKELSSTLQG